MKHNFMKVWSGEKVSWYAGIDIFDWAVPVKIASYGKNQFTFALLCFYVSVEWD